MLGVGTGCPGRSASVLAARLLPRQAGRGASQTWRPHAGAWGREARPPARASPDPRPSAPLGGASLNWSRRATASRWRSCVSNGLHHATRRSPARATPDSRPSAPLGGRESKLVYELPTSSRCSASGRGIPDALRPSSRLPSLPAATEDAQRPRHGVPTQERGDERLPTSSRCSASGRGVPDALRPSSRRVCFPAPSGTRSVPDTASPGMSCRGGSPQP